MIETMSKLRNVQKKLHPGEGPRTDDRGSGGSARMTVEEAGA
jgi:hypothetical protein